MPTSKRPNEVKEEIINLTKIINIWLDEQTSELCVEMANGMRFEVPLSPEEFKEHKKQGTRVVK